ncbi:hypothetical protein DNW11_17835 [Salmonella enterica subsp. enterica serovar Jodhpur]|nr:hypothetical protein [Salmonella enterica subsp. enterica serovar Jodhpur]
MKNGLSHLISKQNPHVMILFRQLHQQAGQMKQYRYRASEKFKYKRLPSIKHDQHHILISNNSWGLIEGLILIFKIKFIKIQTDKLEIASSQRSQIPVFRLTYKSLFPVSFNKLAWKSLPMRI